jgi:hypothetical protein
MKWTVELVAETAPGVVVTEHDLLILKRPDPASPGRAEQSRVGVTRRLGSQPGFPAQLRGALPSGRADLDGFHGVSRQRDRGQTHEQADASGTATPCSRS